MRMTGAGRVAFGMALLSGALSWNSGQAASQEDAPQGYRIAQELLVGDGTVLEVLEDRRITAQLHAQSWGNGLDEETFDESTDSELQPRLEARVRLVSAVGEILAEEALGYPLAKVEKAPLGGLPFPVFFLTVDQTAPMGTYSGPATQILAPTRSRLEPMPYRDEQGKQRPLTMAQTGKAAWQVMAPAPGATESIAQVSSAPADEGDDFVTTYRTYRWVDGQWAATSRQQPGYWDAEDEFPEVSVFP
ncbi:hypothetical protein [Pseudomonas chlororaphis]|uniref:Uncharacterized protein n=1 Tax=Pseudomonas chlororaphis TaxID=587753 RepID=A0A0D5XUJ3_9PSED|nr:hypothetical protein [Pseudomonas chlororaphis]AKA22359.1 hypothetical protein PCL1606_09040 [Pseudomonas chlororaphis]